MDLMPIYRILLVLVCCVVMVCVAQVAQMNQGTHHADHHADRARTLKDKGKIHDQKHIMEHLEGQINKPESEMTDEELQFHYFKMHDYDNNNKLDGIELVSAMTHYHKEDEGDDAPPLSEAEMEEMIDQILQEDDGNKDGYIDFPEFALSTM
ncbi:NSCDNSF-like protein precursor [Saccoglossus kowalevskii]|uniref:NSCDNSF-like protein n=1 Tax=Saccoglossus kowalevskii TaxID=10224 RepID=D1LX99_SACKO|nr:NSCDNSF-like protein precursor [Saccoglossus kowalevskii]ACY92605.1 NSCDNSF-like protein [Saccoglossus kowalevskii]